MIMARSPFGFGSDDLAILAERSISRNIAGALRTAEEMM
jgi:hypothetical protein